MVEVFSKIEVPDAFQKEMDNQIAWLKKAQEQYGDVATPAEFE